jgi:hypothetical protein
MTVLTPMEQRLQTLEAAAKELHTLQDQFSRALGPAQAAMRPQLTEVSRRVCNLRAEALKTLQPGDLNGFIRAIGVVHAYETCKTLGIGSFQALLACTQNQFALWARPHNLGWGAADAVPLRIDPDIVMRVEAVIRSLGCRWREPHEKARVRLPEPVLSRAFDPSFDPKARFKPEDFSGYAHPSLVNGIPGVCGKITDELNRRGIYSWEDLTLRSLSDLQRLGFHGSADLERPEGQFALVQREMRRRGLRFLREQPPAAVAMDAIDTDRINPESIIVKELLSFEDKIKVRDAVGNVVSVIQSDNEMKDRVGAEDATQVHAGYGDQGAGAHGVVEIFAEEEEQEVDVKEEEDAPQPAQSAPAPSAPPTPPS